MKDREFNRDEYISECYATPAHNVRRPHKHAELIKAWADGAEIQIKVEHIWEDARPNFLVWNDEYEYRIKPEPKPDVVTYLMCNVNNNWIEYGIYHHSINHKGVIKLTFDGETGELKSAEVLK